MANIIDETVKIAPLVSIEVSTKGTNTYIGAYSVVDDFVKIKHVGGNGDIRIGEYVFLNSGCVLYSGNGITIGNNVLIGPNCNIVPVNHEFKDPDTLIRLQGFQSNKGGIIIEDDVWIGAGVTILDGAIIGKGAVIGANSLVTGEIEKYSICLGIPSRVIAHRLK